MRRFFLSFAAFALMGASAIGIISCSDDDNDIFRNLYPNALVTVKPVSDNSFFMQLDDNITLKPVNMTSSPYSSREVRALLNFDYVKEDASPYNRAVWVNWIDSILTKPAVPITELEPSVEYGDDAVEIVRDWVTIAEDGYLTLRFRTLWGIPSRPHSVNLATGVNPDDPYEVEFFHVVAQKQQVRVEGATAHHGSMQRQAVSPPSPDHLRPTSDSELRKEGRTSHTM